MMESLFGHLVVSLMPQKFGTSLFFYAFNLFDREEKVSVPDVKTLPRPKFPSQKENFQSPRAQALIQGQLLKEECLS